ncbi:MAG TPA: hypothetical protein VLF79_02555 [Candidatus Saccharimonadales bacterium]|nr:hypothetical protein [Candidatus Saccharimonadales bacterium]
MSSVETTDFQKGPESNLAIFQSVPAEVRSTYQYWQSADLGRIALVIGKELIVVDDSDEPHFTEDYQLAVSDAEKIVASIGNGHSQRQAIVFALNKLYRGSELAESTDRTGYFVYPGRITANMIDPYSRATIKQKLRYQVNAEI